MRETWMTWRRPLFAGAVLLMVGLLAVAYVRRDGRRLVVKPNMVVLAAAPDVAEGFFRDSAFLVRLGVQEGNVPLIHVRVQYAGAAASATMLLGPRELRRAIEAVVAERRGAQLQVVPGGTIHPSLYPGVALTLSFWGEGGFSSSVDARCVWPDPRGVEPWVAQVRVSNNIGSMNSEEGLRFFLPMLIAAAKEVRCPAGGQMRLAADRPEDRHARGEPAASAPRSPPIVASNRQAFAAAVARNSDVTRLALTTDTMTIRVGEVVSPEQALHLRGLRADGSEAARFVPLYEVADPRVAAMGRGGIRGVSPGTTRVSVQVLGALDAPPSSGGASATFVVKVQP